MSALPWPDAATSGAATTEPSSASQWSIADVEMAMAELDRMSAQQLADVQAFMRRQGCPPERWTLVLPLRFRHEVPLWPECVAFSTAISAPVFIRKG